MPVTLRKTPGKRTGVPNEISVRANRILDTLDATMPTVRVELDSSNPLELLVATILSAQCTDDRVNQVTPRLFAKYRTAADYAKAVPEELETFIRSTGFYKSKAKHLIGCGKVLQERFGGKVPGRMEDLTSLPGVGRKTANVILGSYFGQPAIVVDTHVKRVSNRLGFTTSQDPDRIELDLQKLFPEAKWTTGAQRLLLHGRYVCQARLPQCGKCVIEQDCLWDGKVR